jgi:hypothetical protein
MVEYIIPHRHIRDLSVSGFFVDDPHPYHIGESIELRLLLGESAPILATGMVRRVEPGKGMAVEFIRIDADARRRIKEYISHSGPAKT